MNTLSHGMLAPSRSNRHVSGKIWGNDWVMGPPDLDQVLEDERDADGRDQGRQPRRVAQRPVGESLDANAQEAHQRHRDGEREQEHHGEHTGSVMGP